MEEDPTATSTIFSTPVTVHCMGNAIVVDLKQALGGIAQVPEPHMTVLYRQRGYSAEEARQVQEFVDEELRGEGEGEGGAPRLVSFTLSRWGQSSDLIHGPLEELAKAIAAKFEAWGQDGAYRPPHVQLRPSPPRRRNGRGRR